MENKEPAKNIFENNLKIKANSDLINFKKEIADAIKYALFKYDFTKQQEPLEFSYCAINSHWKNEVYITLNKNTEDNLNKIFIERSLSQF